MIVEERRLRIPGLLERVRVACDFVVDAAERAGLDERAVYHCQMAVDEACTNIIEHGYGKSDDKNAIDIVCLQNDTAFKITIMDDSPAFNPLVQTDPDPKANLDKRSIGGWGIYFIKKLMDDVHYHHEGKRNHLHLTKRLTASTVNPQQGHQPITPIATLELDNDIWVLLPSGRIDNELSVDIEATVSELIDQGFIRFIFDMSSVEYVSSVGFKTIMNLCKRVRLTNGNMALSGLTPNVLEVVQIIGLDLALSIYPTPRDAAADYEDWIG